MDKTSYPLIVLKNLKLILKRIKNIEDANNNIIERYDYTDAIVALRPSSQPEFYFDVIEPYRYEEIIKYKFNLRPTSEMDEGMTEYHEEGEKLIEKLEQWIELMKEYESFSFSDEEAIIKQYEEEFYTEWEILDEDADEKAFEPDRQILLYNWLTLLERDLKSNHSLNKENQLAEEAAELRNNIQNLTKRQFVIKFAKLMSKIKKTGLKLLSEILDVAKKEALKKLLYGGIEGIGDITQQLF